MALPRYYPFMHGVYDVKAGISTLGKDFGNGALDSQVFQVDDQFEVYHAAKRHAMSHHSQHFFWGDIADAAVIEIGEWMIDRLNDEHPGSYAGKPGDCGLVGIGLLIQEDIAVLQIDQRGRNQLTHLNIAMPSGWAPEDKIGKPFDAVHAPVPHIGPLSAKQHAIAKLMVHATRGAVRFAWTITDDPALNHHPERDRSIEHPTPLPDHPVGEPLLRVERQVIWGFPEHRASLFLIRTYLYPFNTLETEVRAALAQAVAGMSEASLQYKNMDRALILERLA
ncbi:MAG: heme-dependent oxidative N-demethylase subunit alpha family protein [Planctomycetota bacterium]